MLNELLLVNERINKTPLNLFNTLFTVTDKETDIQGYWQENGQLFKDNIIQETYSIIYTDVFNARIKTMFTDGEHCVFYKDIYNYGTLSYPDGTWQVLKKRTEIIYTCKPCELDIKLLLKNCNGLTVYKIDNGSYLVEIYKA